MIAENIAFGITAFAMAVGAVRVVTTKNVVHAALWLMLVLGGVAANYILLAAEFVAVVQVIVYIGAIVVLFLFGVLASLFAKEFGRRHVNTSQVQRTADVAKSVFTLYVVPFEVVSVVLLAALVGAVVIARRD